LTTFQPPIEGLRALAVVLVIAYHFGAAWLPGGFVGVDVFFVLSGYLITLSLAHAHRAEGRWRDELAAFWARRVRRLLPNALVVLAALGLAGLLALSDRRAALLGEEVAWAAGYAVNWLFVDRASDYLRWGDNDASLVLNYWSLSVEEQFYLLWPLLLVAAWRLGADRGTTRLPLLVALLVLAASLALALVQGESQRSLAFLSTPARAWELLAGAALALATGGAMPAWCAAHGSALAASGLAAILLAALAMSHESRHPGPVTLLPVLGTVLAMAGMLGRPDSLIARCLSSAPMLAIGARSYSLYLWHWPVMAWSQQQGGREAWTPWAKGLSLLVAVALAEAAYRWVEAPARWRWGRAARPSRVLLAGALGSGAVVALGAAVHWMAEEGVRPELARSVPRRADGLPPLKQTLTDLPAVYAMGCHLDMKEERPPPFCRLGTVPEGPAALLFGDSHAAQWVPAVLPVAAGRGVALLAWTKSSCPSADVTVFTEETGGPYASCDRWREGVLSSIERAPGGSAARPALVIVSNLDPRDTVLVDRRNGALLRGAVAAAEFEAGLTRTLLRLQAAGVPVVLIRDTPRARADVLDCLYSAPSPDTCERPRAEALAQTAADLRAAQATGTPVWDFGDDICGPRACPVLMAGAQRAVYRDETHLTATFAASLAPAVARRWPPGVGRPR
jgi:peptidoglycan/LPS O-acetylase OafA/YrhL